MDIQNFFRVVAGHIAREIVKLFPGAGGAPTNAPNKGCKKNQRRFWGLLVYTRLLTWEREYQAVSKYILQNTLEALNIIAYRPCKHVFNEINRKNKLSG